MDNQKREALIEFRGDRSQAEMAEEYGVSQQAWSKYESGKAKPELGLMLRISKEANKPIEEIFLP